MDKICTIESCSNNLSSKGLCEKHRWHMRKHGRILERTRADKNEIFVKDEVCYVQLYDQSSNKDGVVKIDELDRSKIEKHKWHNDGRGYASGMIGKKQIKMHRFILGVQDKRVFVDHINHDTLDNRRSNLRIVSHNENVQNNICLGISWCKRDKKWNARLTKNKKLLLNKYFDKKEDALKARHEAEKKYFGEFANLVHE